MTPAAPASIALFESAAMGARPAAETPTITGTPARAVTRWTTLDASSAESLPASPIIPRTVRPVAPFSR